MNKLLTILIAFAFAVASNAQETTSNVSPEKNVIKVNTLSLLLGTGSLFYEHGFSEKISGQLGVGYLNYGTSNNRFSGLFLTPEFRYYPKNNAIDGMYLAPYLRYQNLSVKVDPYKATLTNFGGGFVFGRQWITNSGFTMDLFFGGHYTSANLDVESGTESDFKISAFDGFGMRFGFALGFGF